MDIQINLFKLISAVKQLFAINRIQNKSFCLHNICVCFVYFLLCIHKYTYIFWKYLHVFTCLYTLNQMLKNGYRRYLFVILNVHFYLYFIHIYVFISFVL